MRLIDADVLCEALEKMSNEPDYQHPDEDWRCGVSMAQGAVEESPTVEAVPLPCKVGDEVWCLRDTRVYNKPVKGVVSEIYFRDNMDMCIVVRRLCRGRWGERVFATEQEAQAVIDRRMNDEKSL